MDGLSILSGGIVEVDPASLREVAARLRSLTGEVDEAAAAATRAGGLAVPTNGGDVLLARAVHVLHEAAQVAADLAHALGAAADLYDAVDALTARTLASAAGDADAVRLADARIRTLVVNDPMTMMRAVEMLRRADPGADLRAQTLEVGAVLGPALGTSLLTSFALAGLLIAGRGIIPAGGELDGASPPVRVQPAATGRAVPPASLADAAARIPGGGAARVRVERYVTNSGPQFVVYIAGTQALAGADPFDMVSNAQLYGGDVSASYAATLAALEAAGARPGDVVHAVGHSQGAMIGERLAAGGPYDVQTVVSFGSPVQADLGDGTLAVTVRHSDDPVAALQGGGLAGPTGAAGGFAVSREADPRGDLGDVLLPAHQMSAYRETAALVDASDDPRVEALRSVFDQLGTARSGVAVDYAAERVSPSASDGR